MEHLNAFRSLKIWLPYIGFCKLWMKMCWLFSGLRRHSHRQLSFMIFRQLPRFTITIYHYAIREPNVQTGKCWNSKEVREIFSSLASAIRYSEHFLEPLKNKSINLWPDLCFTPSTFTNTSRNTTALAFSALKERTCMSSTLCLAWKVQNMRNNWQYIALKYNFSKVVFFLVFQSTCISLTSFLRYWI